MPQALRLTRELVDLIPASIEDPGPAKLETDFTADNYHQKTAYNVLQERPDGGELWVFAFGSLIWKPRFTHNERRVARVDGWQRNFCMGPDVRYRGNPKAPGYMLSLVEGGHCKGVVFRMAVRCIGFVCPEMAFEFLGNPTPKEKIKCLATGVGKFGSMPDYVLNTVQCLEDAGIHDPYIWEMQALVAEYLEGMA